MNAPHDTPGHAQAAPDDAQTSHASQTAAAPDSSTGARLGALTLEWVDPSTLTPNPRNWRRHPTTQRDALAGVLDDVGWAGAALFNRRTGRLIDGHLRLDVALQRGDDAMPVLVGEWDDAQEAEILATLDPIAALADTDGAALTDLLRDVSTGSAAVMDVLGRLADDAALFDPTSVEFDEFDESVVDEVDYHTCPSCGHEWPK